MNRTFFQNDYLSSVPFLSAPASARGYWVALQGYLSRRETGGVLRRCRLWGRSEWRVILGLGGGKAAVQALVDAGLASWRGDDLLVAGYDHESEQGYQRQREGGRRGGLARAANEHRSEQGRSANDTQASENPGDGFKGPSSLAAESSFEEIREVEPRQGSVSPPHHSSVSELDKSDAGNGQPGALLEEERVLAAFGAAVRIKFGGEPYWETSDATTVNVLLTRWSVREVLGAIEPFLKQASNTPDVGAFSSWLGKRPSSRPAASREAFS